MQMKCWLGALTVSVVLCSNLFGQTPAGSTGQCKDGTYTTATKKAGACSGHKGVQSWYAAPAGAPSATQPAAAAQTPASSAASASTQDASPVQTSTPRSGAGTAAHAKAPGGGPGMVWVNSGTKVYHCPGTRYYGTTKNGKYLSEADAKAEGDHADHGKVCTQ